MDNASVFAEISKTAEQEDGSLLVYGKATDDSLDLDDQRCDPKWLAEAMPAWFGTGTGTGGNIRSQHDPKSAVGKALEHEAAADGHYITAKIVDRDAIAKTKAGVFTGFSIGVRRPKIVKSPIAPNGLIAGGMITEVSLCDRPANPACTLMLCKAAKPGWEGSPADLDEERGLVKCEELTVAADVEKAADVETVDQAQAAADEVLESSKNAADDVAIQVEPSDEDATDKATDPATEPLPVAEFDREAAKALVAAIAGKEGTDAAKAAGEFLGKADGDMPAEYGDEQTDSQNAMAAISIISKLIVSEASEMVNNPAEDCDIQILLSAVSALRCFITREQQQSLGENDVDHGADVLVLAADAEVEKAKYSSEQLQQMLKDGKALKNANGEPSYPIGDKDDLEKAIHAVGRGAGDHDSIRAYIVRRAKALGASNMIPDSWDSSSKAVEPDVEKVQVHDTDPVDIAAIAKAAADERFDERLDELTKTITGAVIKTLVGDSLTEDALEKATVADSGDEDQPVLHKHIESIVEAKTEPTAKSVSDLAERVGKVEQMATPGGPALRRTEADRNTARKNDLVMEAARFKALAETSHDENLRKGYDAKARQLEAQYKAL